MKLLLMLVDEGGRVGVSKERLSRILHFTERT